MPQSELPKKKTEKDIKGFDLPAQKHRADGFNSCHSQFSEAMVERLEGLKRQVTHGQDIEAMNHICRQYNFDIDSLINEIQENEGGV